MGLQRVRHDLTTKQNRACAQKFPERLIIFFSPKHSHLDKKINLPLRKVEREISSINFWQSIEVQPLFYSKGYGS